MDWPHFRRGLGWALGFTLMLAMPLTAYVQTVRIPLVWTYSEPVHTVLTELQADWEPGANATDYRIVQAFLGDPQPPASEWFTNTPSMTLTCPLGSSFRMTSIAQRGEEWSDPSPESVVVHCHPNVDLTGDGVVGLGDFTAWMRAGIPGGVGMLTHFSTNWGNRLCRGVSIPHTIWTTLPADIDCSLREGAAFQSFPE